MGTNLVLTNKLVSNISRVTYKNKMQLVLQGMPQMSIGWCAFSIGSFTELNKITKLKELKYFNS